MRISCWWSVWTKGSFPTEEVESFTINHDNTTVYNQEAINTTELTACRRFNSHFLQDSSLITSRTGSMKHQFNRESLKSYPDCKGWARRSRRSSRCGGTPATWCWRCAHSWRWRGRCRWASCRPAGARCSCRSGSSEWSWGCRNATGSTCKSAFCFNSALCCPSSDSQLLIPAS